MPLTNDQHKRRSSGIGGSESYVAAGFTAFNRTPVVLWAEKTGRTERGEIPEGSQERVAIGNKIEDVIAELYAEKTGRRVRRSQRNYQHPEREHMRCYVDRLVEKSGRILECKNVDSLQHYRGDWGDPGTDEVPLNYFFQCQHMLAVTGRDVCDLAALVGGNTLMVYTIEADPAFHKMLYKALDTFWQCVVQDVPPTALTAEDIALLYPRERDGVVPRIADPNTAVKVQRLRMLKQRAKAHSDEIEALSLELKTYIADAPVLIDFAGMELATFKANKPRDVTDWKAAYQELAQRTSHPDADRIVERHTTERQGNRPLLLKDGEKPFTD